MKTKKNLLLWQRIVGVILCVALIVGMVLPFISIRASKIAKEVAKIANSTSELVGQDILGDAQEEYEKQLEENIEDEIKESGLEKFTSVSLLKMVTISPQNPLKQKNSSGLNTADFFSEMSNNQIQKLISAYNFVRIFLVICMVLDLILLCFAILEWVGIFNKWVVNIVSWICTVLNACIPIAWFLVIPAKLVNMSMKAAAGEGNYLISSLAKPTLEQIFRKFFQIISGPSAYILIVIPVLLLIWNILCIVIHRREPEEAYGLAGEYSAQDGPYISPNTLGNDENIYGENPYASPEELSGSAGQVFHGGAGISPLGGADMQTMPLENVVPVQTPVAVAKEEFFGMIRGVQGTIMGAEIAMRAGDRIVLGRNPEVCQLILENKKISRKHCEISYLPQQGVYQVLVYSANGVKLSDGRKIEAGHQAVVQRHTSMNLADGQEVIMLD